MNTLLPFITICFVSILIQGSVSAATIHIPSDLPGIQESIDATSHGDTLIVSAGVYNEYLDFRGKSIVLISESGPENTIIDGSSHGHSIVSFTSGEGPGAVLSGFTLRNGNGTFIYEDRKRLGGAILCSDGSSPTISGNILADNSTESGGAIACSLGWKGSGG